jgi:predicted MFS family arabinose efflux permease
MPPVLVAVAADLDAPLASIVQAAGVYFLAYGLTQPVWGLVSDSLGRVRTMRLTLLAAGLAAVAAAFAWSPLTLGLARGVGGAFVGAAYPAGLIYVGDTVPAARRQRDVTRLMVGVAVGTALASVGAGLVAHLFTWRAAFVATGSAALVMAVALRALPEPPRVRDAATPLAPLLQVVRSRTSVFVLLMAFLEGAVLLGVLTLLPAAVEDAGATASLAGAVTAIYGIAVFAAAALVGRLSRHQHPARLIGLGASSALLACVVLTLSRAPLVAVVVTLLLGLAWASMHSSLQTWATEVLPSARAAVVSLFAGALYCGSALAALLVSGLVDDGRYRAIFLAAAAVAVPLGGLAVWGRARWRGPA